MSYLLSLFFTSMKISLDLESRQIYESRLIHVGGSTPACNSSWQIFNTIILNWSLIMKLDFEFISKEKGPIIVFLIFFSIVYFREDLRLFIHCKQIHDWNINHLDNLRSLQ
jgi:hypothetical protein